MLRLKLNHSPFSPPHIVSFTLRSPSAEELEAIRRLSFDVSEGDGHVTFSLSLDSLGELPFGDEAVDMVEWARGKPWEIELPGGRSLRKKDRPLVMGILNVTPDSFYDGGRYSSLDRAVKRAMEMVEQGADIIDIGGESTRPGSQGVDLDEELRRVVPVVEELRKRSDVVISVDTTKSEVAERALDAGADMVNDISGFRFDGRMAELCSKKGVPAVLMHTTGRPSEMQKKIHYKDLIWDILDYLHDSMNLASGSGLSRDMVIVDPGIGFGKRPEHNLTIVNRIVEFKSLRRPVLVGASRKSFIGVFLGLERPEDRLEGSLAVAALLAERGADVLRVHDVRETRMVVEMVKHIVEEG